MSERSHDTQPSPAALATDQARRVDGGRLGVYAAIGATLGTVPLPWIPAALVRSVRGALVHDVATRHGFSLSNEAREVLADSSSPDAPSGTVSRALKYASKRLALRALTRIGPLRALWPLGQAFQLYALGALLDRYLSVRPADDPRGRHIERPEALRVRRAIDGAMARVLETTADPVDEPASLDDRRDRATAVVDGLLDAAASLPAHLMGRLHRAFDALLAAEP
jgi:hypothetical protein